jgi:hypothetical protein
VGMDLYGELPATFLGNRWVLVSNDHFTKWPEIIPLRRIDAPTIEVKIGMNSVALWLLHAAQQFIL